MQELTERNGTLVSHDTSVPISALGCRRLGPCRHQSFSSCGLWEGLLTWAIRAACIASRNTKRQLRCPSVHSPNIRPYRSLLVVLNQELGASEEKKGDATEGSSRSGAQE